LTTSGGDQLYIEAGSAADGFAQVTLNDEDIFIGEMRQLTAHRVSSHGWVAVNSTHELSLSIGPFDLEIENNDGFVNLRSVAVSADNWNKLAAHKTHGLLGQTWQAKKYTGKIKEIEGDVDDYLIEDDDMFSNTFRFNRFSPIETHNTQGTNTETSDM